MCEATPIKTVVDATRNVFCGYDDETENDQESLTITCTSAWTCSDTTRDLVANNVPDSRPSVDLYALGTFSQDWEYVEATGDLDECNGRFGVTPEFPSGIYHYYATDSYPYFQGCVNGEAESDAGGPPTPQ